MAVCRDWRRAAREDVRFHALRVRAPLRVLHTAQGAATDPMLPEVLPEIDVSTAQVCAPALHLLCTCSAPALHLLCTHTAPAFHLLRSRTRSAPTPSVQAARFTDVALRRCLSAAGARLTSLTLHQLPAITG